MMTLSKQRNFTYICLLKAKKGSKRWVFIVCQVDISGEKTEIEIFNSYFPTNFF